LRNKNTAGRIILLAKQSGLTSFASLYTVKRAFKTSKVGHTGTLDSFAEGLLVVCTGSLTRLAGRITQFDKTYEAVIRFGEETDTLECTGSVVKTAPLPSKSDFENILLIIPTLEVQNKTVNNFIELKRQFENDITDLEEKIKIIDENSKVYMNHIFKFNKEE